MRHRLRFMVHPDSPTVTDNELTELSTRLPFDDYMDGDKYEYSGNWIITKDLAEREAAYEQMCCGKVLKDIKLSNGEEIYFAFDYGH